MKLVPEGLLRRALASVVAYLLVMAAAAVVGTLGEVATMFAWAAWYVGAAAVFVLTMSGFARRYAGRLWHILLGLILSAALAAFGAFVALVIMVNIWENAGMPH